MQAIGDQYEMQWFTFESWSINGSGKYVSASGTLKEDTIFKASFNNTTLKCEFKVKDNRGGEVLTSQIYVPYNAKCKLVNDSSLQFYDSSDNPIGGLISGKENDHFDFKK